MKFKLIIDTEENIFETIGELQLHLAVAYKIGFRQKTANIIQAGNSVELQNDNYEIIIQPIGN